MQICKTAKVIHHPTSISYDNCSTIANWTHNAKNKQCNDLKNSTSANYNPPIACLDLSKVALGCCIQHITLVVGQTQSRWEGIGIKYYTIRDHHPNGLKVISIINPFQIAYLLLSKMCRSKVKVLGNHGMIYIAKLKGLLLTMYLPILSSVGIKQQDCTPLRKNLQRVATGRMILY